VYGVPVVNRAFIFLLGMTVLALRSPLIESLPVSVRSAA